MKLLLRGLNHECATLTRIMLAALLYATPAWANLTVERWEVGWASWYNQGHVTASGEGFNRYAMTAASRSLPFGTVVAVIAEDGKRVLVRINDRGPYAGTNRVIDLTEEAGRRLGIAKAGLAKVSVRVLWQKKTSGSDTTMMVHANTQSPDKKRTDSQNQASLARAPTKPKVVRR